MLKDPAMTASRRLLAEMLLLALDNMDTPLGERFLRLTEKVFGGQRSTFRENDSDKGEETDEDDFSALSAVLNASGGKEDQ
jgi:hypothetical protein